MGYYVKCDSVDCCKDASTQALPDVKKWDIGQGKKSAITHMDATDLDDLDGHVAGADTWLEDIGVLGAHVKYTYYITQSEIGDVISHAIDYEAPGAAPGRILYGNFTAKHADELMLSARCSRPRLNALKITRSTATMKIRRSGTASSSAGALTLSQRLLQFRCY